MDNVERLLTYTNPPHSVRQQIADEIKALRAELATERKRQSAMRTLITSLESTISLYRDWQAKADEAVRTLDSEREANATLTAEIAQLRELIEQFCKSLTARVKVENEIANILAGQLPMPDAAKLKEWAVRLGVPEETREQFRKAAEGKSHG